MNRNTLGLGLLVSAFGLFGTIFSAVNYLHHLQMIAACKMEPSSFSYWPSAVAIIFLCVVGPFLIAHSFPDTKCADTKPTSKSPINGLHLPPNS